MQKNIIILTEGWTGSSVFSALFGRAGYWLGSETVKKTDYDTYENVDLVALNDRILNEFSKGLNREHRFDFADVLSIERAWAGHDLKPFADFVMRCSSNGLWVWKDPRLTWTIRVWAHVLDLERTAFLILTRDEMQGWISANLRRHIRSRRHIREYRGGVTRSNLRFLEERRLPALNLCFEGLLLEPERTLEQLNSFYELRLTMQDLQAVCDKPLYRKSLGFSDLVKAVLIHIKNYGERDGRGGSQP